MQETRKGDFWGLELHLWPCQHVGFVYFQTWSLISFNLVIFVSSVVWMLRYICLFWPKRIKQETSCVSLWQCFLSVCSLPPLVQDCWEFETVTNWGGREKDKYAILLSSTCWLLLVTVLVCLVFLYSVFWIWNCDKLRLVREGRRTGMPFPCQWNVNEER